MYREAWCKENVFWTARPRKSVEGVFKSSSEGEGLERNISLRGKTTDHKHTPVLNIDAL